MKSKTLIYFTPVALVTLFILWFFSDTQILQRRTQSIIETLELQEGTTRIERSAKSQRLQNLLANQISITYPKGQNLFKTSVNLTEPISFSRERATTAHIYLTETLDHMLVEDLNLGTPEVQEDSAIVPLTFELTAKQKNRPQKSSVLDGTFTFRKVDGNWKLSKVIFQP